MRSCILSVLCGNSGTHSFKFFLSELHLSEIHPQAAGDGINFSSVKTFIINYFERWVRSKLQRILIYNDCGDFSDIAILFTDIIKHMNLTTDVSIRNS